MIVPVDCFVFLLFYFFFLESCQHYDEGLTCLAYAQYLRPESREGSLSCHNTQYAALTGTSVFAVSFEGTKYPNLYTSYDKQILPRTYYKLDPHGIY